MAKKILASALASALVLFLTVLFHRNISNSFLLYALLPGTIVNLLITGGHGGPFIEERIGVVAGVVVNCLVYTW
jgi:hypothetical protein